MATHYAYLLMTIIFSSREDAESVHPAPPTLLLDTPWIHGALRSRLASYALVFQPLSIK